MSNPHVRQLLDLIKEQNKAIEKLMAERDSQRQEISALVGWIQEDRDALMALQQIYNSPTADESSRIKAAIGALPFERGKPASVVIQYDFKERVRNARLRTIEQNKARWAAENAAKVIEHQPATGTVLGEGQGEHGAWRDQDHDDPAA
jgi:hypothetical protein